METIMQDNQTLQDVEQKIKSIEAELTGHLSFSEQVELKARLMCDWYGV